MRPLACFFAKILKKKRSTWDRHGNDFRLSAATMNGKFESNSNNYDESNLNRLHGHADELIDSIQDSQGGAKPTARANAD